MWNGGFSSGRQALEGIEVGGNEGGFGFSPPGRIYQSYYESKTISNGGPPGGSLGKRAAPTAYPPSPLVTKLSTQPNHSRIPTTISSPTIPMHNQLLQLLEEHPSGVPVAKLPGGLRSLSPKEIFGLGELDALCGSEGQLKIDEVSPEDVARWESEYPSVMENKNIRQEYNSLNGRFIIKCSTTPTHEALSQFFSEGIFGSLNERFGRKRARSLVRVGHGLSMQSISSS